MKAYSPDEAPKLEELKGMDAAVKWASHLGDDLQQAVAGKLPWKMLDRGALLVGPPGTGKTLFARSLAKSCHVHFMATTASRWQAGADLGELLAAMRKDFDQADAMSPSILFIDEIDAVGNRSRFSGPNAQYQTEVVNALLEELDGFDGDRKVIVLAATNNPENVDPALRRPGRLDREIPFRHPGPSAACGILAHHLEQLPCKSLQLTF